MIDPAVSYFHNYGEAKGSGWFFLDQSGSWIGPYPTRLRAINKYEEYCAYTYYAPACHHS